MSLFCEDKNLSAVPQPSSENDHEILDHPEHNLEPCPFIRQGRKSRNKSGSDCYLKSATAGLSLAIMPLLIGEQG